MGERVEFEVPGTDTSLGVIRHGHWGRPVLVFPSEAGRAEDFAEHGMLDAIGPLVDDGRVSLFCVDSADAWTWSDNHQPTESRARGHERYVAWLVEQVFPYIREQMHGSIPVITTGVSLGAYHAVNLTLSRPDLAPLAIGMSGAYDPNEWHGWGETGQSTYFANPFAYVAGMDGDHLAWVRENASVLLVVGEGPFEWHPTRAYPSTHALADLLRAKGIRHELDVWGFDSAHDWPWWAKQLAHHLPRFC